MSKRVAKKLVLRKNTLSNLSLGQATGGTGTGTGCDTIGCASIMTECNSIDIRCNSQNICYTSQCAKGGSGGYRPPLPKYL